MSRWIQTTNGWGGCRALRWVLAAVVVVSVQAMSAPRAGGCGPYISKRILTAGDEDLLALPPADFGHEMDRLIPADDPAYAVVPANDGHAVQTAAAGRRDLDLALAASDIPLARWQGVLDAYAEYRERLERASAVRAEAKRAGRDPGAWLAPPVPEGLPAQFALYLQGAAAYHGGDMETARGYWRQVLQLPEAQRRQRSVWAAYMLGRASVDDAPAEAVRWFATTRRLVDEGYRDSVGLAASSLGWEGRAHLNLRAHDEALRCYFEQHRAGDGSALMSLRTAAREALRDEGPALERCAADPLLQRVVTAYLLSRGWPRQVGHWGDQAADDARAVAWLEAVEAGGQQGVAGADRLSWLAYQRGQMERAQRWAARAEATPIALWVRAKLALRAGDVEGGTALLARTVQALPEDLRWDDLVLERAVEKGYYGGARVKRVAEGELARLRLTAGQYGEAMDLLLRGEHIAEALYLAEHVLSADELRDYIEARQKAVGATAGTAWLQRVLANRLIRAGRLDEARPWLSFEDAKLLDQWANAVRLGRDGSLDDADRVDALWLAATLVMTDAQHLFRFHAEPVWHVERRDGFHPRYAQHRPGVADQPLSGPGAGELVRLDEHAAEFARAQHYPFIAADLAWEAIELMPDNDEGTAYRLCIAGSWIMYRDPEAADRLYKALCRRCPQTELGREAIRRRWFPKLTDQPLYLTK